MGAKAGARRARAAIGSHTAAAIARPRGAAAIAPRRPAVARRAAVVGVACQLHPVVAVACRSAPARAQPGGASAAATRAWRFAHSRYDVDPRA